MTEPGVMGSGRCPHVVMVVANDVRNDTLVRESALAVAALGARVTVVGVTTAPRRWDTVLGVTEGSASAGGEVRVVRVPVDFALSRARSERRARLRCGELPPLAPDPAAESLARRRLVAAELDAGSVTGPAASLRRAAVDVRRFLLRARGVGRRRAARGASLGFEAVDRVWQQVTWAASPQRVIPEADDLELAVGPVLDQLEPDVVHAHGVHLVGVVARHVARARAAGRAVRWLYGAREGIPGLPWNEDRTARVTAAWSVLEQRFIGGADAVVTVSAPLAEVYREVLRTVCPEGVLAAAPPVAPFVEPTERLVAGRLPDGVRLPLDARARAGEEPAVLAIGPANSAGQGWAWAQAAQRHLAGVRGHVVAIRNGRYDYAADELVEPATYRADPVWQLRKLAEARSRWTHVLLEAGRPILGGLVGRDFTGDVQLLRDSGVRVGLVMHGSEVRDPRRHRAHHEFSPFADPRDPLTRKLQAKTDLLLPRVAEFAAAGGQVFVSTPDQLDDVPQATWLPVVVDPEAWPVRDDTLTRDRPLFVHAPSNPQLKGTAVVESVLGPLADRGVIEFRLVSGLPPAQAAELVANADVVVDQLLLGLYGVLACEAMASGRVVLGHLGRVLRHRVGRPVPVVEVTPRTLSEVVEQVLDDRGWAREQAEQGPGFVRAVHGGGCSAAVLAPFLGRTADTGGMPPGSESAEVTAW
jgi:hypothetical protein